MCESVWGVNKILKFWVKKKKKKKKKITRLKMLQKIKMFRITSYSNN